VLLVTFAFNKEFRRLDEPVDIVPLQRREYSVTARFVTTQRPLQARYSSIFPTHTNHSISHHHTLYDTRYTFLHRETHSFVLHTHTTIITASAGQTQIRNPRTAMLSTTFLIAVLATLIPLITAISQYTLTDDLTYNNFFDAFGFYDGPDPTNGFVKYQKQEHAIKQNLVGYLEDAQSVLMRVDYTTKDPAGRASVRL
jgi:hypothetical protein